MDQHQMLNIINHLLSEYRDEKSQYGSLYAEEPLQDVLGDFLTDLRHFCRSQRLDFDKAARLSELHFEAESEL